ncbi:hypothetical protein HYU11_00595 [Candidatus Woesearchaeota archaeon]|nr:hypothetical protein [Candidatus Woesearchaeota archaeon]
MKKGEEKKVQKEVASDELELPPPPQIESFSSGLPSFEGPKLEMPVIGKLDIPVASMNKPSEAGQDLIRLPDIKQIDDQKFVFDQPSMQVPPVSVPAFENPVMTKPALEKPAIVQSAKPYPDQPVYIKGHKFRAIIEDIDSLLKSQKILDEELVKIRRMKDEEYEKWSKCLEDMQRRLMFIDQNLFEV